MNSQKSEIVERPRRGITLTEVLISMGLMTLGLLGVMSLFPVGSHYMLEAEKADRSAAIAKATMNDIVARGLLDPRLWTGPPVTAAGFDGPSYASFVELHRLDLQTTDVATFKNWNTQLGSAIIIDPLGVANFQVSNPFAQIQPDAKTTALRWLTNFPGRQWFGYIGSNAPKYWEPWIHRTAPITTPFLGPVRRVTYEQLVKMDADGVKPSVSLALNRPEDIAARLAAAERLCRATDELASDLPNQDDRPAMQNWQMLGVNPVSRQSVGDYSWLVSVAPTSAEARNHIGMEGFAYDVSVVVCYKRDFTIRQQNAPSPATTRNWSPSEALLTAAIKSTGPNGGEILVNDGNRDGGLDSLRAGGWIMVCGPQPNSTPIPNPSPNTQFHPNFFLAWYQIQAVDSEIASAEVQSYPQRYVTLRGPEWPWQPRQSHANPAAEIAKLSDDLCVAIFPSAVAVHTKTLRLQ